MDVTVPQAQVLLTNFARAAVAGQVDVQTAGRATIAVMNAWHLPITDTSKVMDIQFQLVRKGVGTYQEFAQSLGQAIPSAQRAGQSFSTLAGMMAYLTRNGLSTSMAAASAQRALDAFSNPKVVQRLQDMGIQVTNNNGGFRKFTDVIGDLQKKLADMTAPERAKALQQLFAGAGGTIQAMRFYNTVLASDSAVKQYQSLTKDMEQSSGALTGAYNTMAGQMTTKTQGLKNQYDLLKIEVGNALIPILSKLIDAASSILKWWNSLSDSTKKSIVYIAAGAAAFTVLAGVVLTVAGVFIMLAAAAALADIALGPIIIVVLGVSLVLAGLIALGYLLITNWQGVKAWAIITWNNIKNFFKEIWFDISSGFKQFVQSLKDLWNAAGIYFKSVWDRVWTNGIAKWAKDLWGGIQNRFSQFVQALGNTWDKVRKLFAVPVNFVIQYVYNDGIRWLWNHIVDGIGLKGIELPQAKQVNWATGGPVFGPGTGTSDSILGWLSNGEHVWTAEEVRKAGGHQAVMALRRMVLGFATGGPVHAIGPAQPITGNPSQDTVKNSGGILGQLISMAGGAAGNVVKWLSDPFNSIMSSAGGGGNWLRAVAQAPATLIGKMVDWLWGKVQAAVKQAASVSTGSLNSGAVQKEIAYAFSQFVKYSWGPENQQPLVNLWNKESGWNPFAVNPSSGAYGIPQALGHGNVYALGDAIAQINWGLNYIWQRYGTPIGAWAHEVANNWYDTGLMRGFLPRGISVVNNGTSGDEHLGVLTTTQWNVLQRLANPGGTYGSSGTGTNVYITIEGINIYTQEIDPKQHATELGDYLTRMGAGRVMG
jgi:TP901 family phage tail tape measure protein